MPRALLVALLVAIAAGLAAGQSVLQNLLGQISPALAAPGWMDNHAPHGVLHDYGIALWEMPDRHRSGTTLVPVTGGGYNHATRALHQDPSFYLKLQPSPQHPLLMTPLDFTTLHRVLFEQDYSKLVLADIGTVYNAGTSVSLQNLVFAPTRTGSTFGFHAYPEVQDILQQTAAASLSVYADVGLQNNWLFTDNLWELAVRHGQKRKAADPLWSAPGLFDPAALRGAGVDTRTMLLLMRLDATVGLPRPRFYPKPMLDVTDPVVIQLAQASLRQLARTWWPRIKFYVGGEYFLTHGPAGAKPTDAPWTDYSARSMTAFQHYMIHLFGSVTAINLRWGIDSTPYELKQITDIGPQHVDPKVSPQAVLDFKAMNTFRTRELRLLQYATAKQAAPGGTYGAFAFSPRGVELAGLGSDFPASGQWYNTEAGYFAPYGQKLLFSANAARLAGTPLGFGITSPPTNAAGGCPTNPGYHAPPIFAPRCFSRALFALTERDVLTAGSVHYGYIKAPGWGTYGSDTSRSILLDHVRGVKAIRDQKLRFMTPYHRVNLHVDPTVMEAFPGPDSVARRLVDRFTTGHVPYAVFSDPENFDRLFAREQLGRGLLVSAFHANLDLALMKHYVQIARQTHPQPGVLVLTDWPTWKQKLGNGPLIPFLNAGLALWKPGLLVFVLVFADAQPQTSQAVLDQVVPLALDLLSPEPPQPITVSQHTAPDGGVESTAVTDGVDYYVAVANRSPTATFQGVTVGVHPRERQRTAAFVTGYTFEGGATFTLKPKETRFVYVGAALKNLGQVTNQAIARKTAEFHAQLDRLAAAGFDVRAGKALLACVAKIDLARYRGRAVVGLARLRNLLFLRATRSGARITVTCRRHDGTPVAGAPVQLLHLLNGREPQDAGPTDAQGTAHLTVAPVTDLRWDFFASVFQPPRLSPATEPVEVHVHDPTTGDEAFLLVP